jgi:LysM repeat protein
MINIIRNALLVTTMLALGACNLFSPATPEANALIAELPALGLTIQIQNATDVFNTVGQIINYNYVITYTGSAALAGPVTVTDVQTPVTCPDLVTVGNLDSSLNQNETITCKSAYSITQADLNTGTVTKNATASAGGVSSNAANIVTTMVQNKSLSLTKSALPVNYNQLGLLITYSYVVKNSGNVTLGPTQFTVTDDHIAAPINCGSNTVTLLPTETVGCTAPYTIVQADLNAASVTNNATASGGGVGPSQPASATINNSNVVRPNPSNLPAGTTIQHTVVAGEWLIQLARCYGADFTDVRNANTHIIDPDIISIGTIVTVPRIGSAGIIYGPPCVGSHTVQTGDTWASIAQRYNADVVVLQAANPGASLSAGSVLKIPLNSAGAFISTPAPTVAPTATPTSTPNPTDPTRISFAEGTTSSTINGTIAAQGASVRYVVAGNQGQLMNVTLTPTPANEVAWAVYDPSGVVIRPLDANTAWSGTLPATGDYRIEIISILGTSSKTYSLVVSITAP